ncbi:TRASH domain-containing protein [Cuniculiplasma sp. SKW3]|uniref:TRASH domain-containing protein n=1 Tax=Cuniculiplasma sp. SKW3 TaxID=3400170 RepID=UPI003FCF8F7C
MKRNLSEIEERLLAILRINSRISIQDAAKEIKASRISVSKAMDSLIQSGKILNFTVVVQDDMRDIGIIVVESIDQVNMEDVIEYFSLMDGTFMLIIYYENLMKFENLKIKDIKIAKKRDMGQSLGRIANIHCDYCDKLILENPRKFLFNNRIYYACCPTCEKNLKSNLKRKEDG